jgi:hypothetical protein
MDEKEAKVFLDSMLKDEKHRLKERNCANVSKFILIVGNMIFLVCTFR